MRLHQGSGKHNPTVLALVLALVGGGASLDAQGQAGEKWQTIPKAVCGPQDRTEILQGATSLAERFAPGPPRAYTCNLELMGQFKGDGAGFGMVFYDKCAYLSSGGQARRPGVPVIDVSDSRRPQITTYLDSPAMRSVNESMAVSERRKLLVGGVLRRSPSPPQEDPGTWFSVYDLSVDCRYPVLKSSAELPGISSHTGEIAPDGLTFYTAAWTGSPNQTAYYAHPSYKATDPPPSVVYAIDLTDPSKPREIGRWIAPEAHWMTHSARVNHDGTRVYVGLYRLQDDYLKAPNVNGLVIFDSSDFQKRGPNPQFRLISTLFWDDSHYTQFAKPITVKGRPYIVFSDLVGAIGAGTSGGAPTDEVRVDACGSGKPSHGFARLIDISDEKAPKTVSKLILEVADPANCTKVMRDPARTYKYGAEGCDVDNSADARLLVCGHFEGGLRVFDIREVAHPKEIAYYKPPAQGTSARSFTADAVMAPFFRKNGKDFEIWFNSADNGFQVVRFSDRFKAAHKDLFPE